MTIGLGPHGGGVLRMVRPGVYLHWCPACERGHTFNIHDLSRDGHVLGFDGDFERPSVGEPLRHAGADGSICEYEIKGGKLTYSPDCTHAMAGKEVPLPEYPR